MPRSKPLPAALLLILTAVFAFAQNPPPPAAAPRGPVPLPSLKKLTDSDVFYGHEQLFQISLPKWRQTYRKLTSEETSANSVGGQYKWVTSEATITITFFHAQGEAEFDTGLSPADYEARAKNLLLEKIKATLVSSKPITLGNYKGAEVIFTMPEGGKGITRNYAQGKWQYTINAFIKGTDPDAEMLAVRALDSFKILTDADRAADLARRIAEATPKDLPQSPVPARPSSDAKDDRLKGNVRSLIRETEDIGAASQKGRKKSFEILFDERGNTLKHTSYDYRDNPGDIKVYGYIDGARVSKTGYVRHEYNPPPAIAPPAPPGAKPVIRDDRYSTKYVYTYDKKRRLTEEAVYSNSGELFYRTTYVYGGDRLEENYLREDGTLGSKTVEISDKKGNVIEQTYSSTTYSNRERKTFYKYESFDSHGNWTKRTVTGKYPKSDGTEGDLNYIEYRTITYYP